MRLPGGAIFDPSGRYRYRLDRVVAMPGMEGPVFGFFGINASSADARSDDHTVRKWRGFSLEHRAIRFIVGNPFALIATEVTDLSRVTDPVGPENVRYLGEIIAEADILIPCWGSRDKVPKYLHSRIDDLAEKLFAAGKPVRCFGLTASGDPAHVLRIGYNTPLVDWVRQ